MTATCSSVTASHCEAIEPVLERHGLAAIARDREGRIRVLGHVPEAAADALSTITGRSLGTDVLPEATAHELLTLLRDPRMPGNGAASAPGAG
jgi:hypothetical protein